MNEIENKQKTKKALILSGGGSHGAYQAGVLKKLTEHGKSWDIVVGVSTGAVNGACIAQFPKNKQKEGAEFLENLWLTDIKGNSSIYKKHLPWIFNYLATLWEGGLYNTQPLLNILKKRFDKEKLKLSGVDLRVCTVSLRTGILETIHKEDMTPEWILASSSMPGIFSPAIIHGDKYVDGGVRNITPISSIIEEKDIEEIDIILADKLQGVPLSDKTFKSIIDIGTRSVEIAINEIFHTDLDYVLYELEHGVKVNVYQPKTELGFDSFDFSPANMKAGILQGYNDTQIISK